MTVVRTEYHKGRMKQSLQCDEIYQSMERKPVSWDPSTSRKRRVCDLSLHTGERKEFWDLFQVVFEYAVHCYEAKEEMGLYGDYLDWLEDEIQERKRRKSLRKAQRKLRKAR